VATWDYNDPSTSELRAYRPADEVPPPHRRHVPTSKWCKGKTGREHDLKIRLKRSVASRLGQLHKYGRDDYRPLDEHARSCRWSWWAWRYYGDWHYFCRHERYCTNCGKIKGGKIFKLKPEDCPEFSQHPKPTISARQAAIDHEAAQRTARR
jgi:hypothetical protein